MKRCVIQNSVCADFIRNNLPMSYGCFAVVALSLLIFLGVSTAVISAFRIPLQRQSSETLKYLVGLCKPFGACVG